MGNKKELISIDKIEDLGEKLTKSQLTFFKDKTKDAMEAYEQLIAVKESCDDPCLAEKVYGNYIFVIYRSIFNKNYIDKNTTVRINHEIFLNQSEKNDLFEIEDIDCYNKLHKLIIDLVNKVYAHTDLGSDYKSIEIEKVCLENIKCKASMTRKIEKGINFDGITKAINVLATAHASIENYIQETDNTICFSKYLDGGWTTVYFK